MKCLSIYCPYCQRVKLLKPLTLWEVCPESFYILWKKSNRPSHFWFYYGQLLIISFKLNKVFSRRCIWSVNKGHFSRNPFLDTHVLPCILRKDLANPPLLLFTMKIFTHLCFLWFANLTVFYNLWTHQFLLRMIYFQWRLQVLPRTAACRLCCTTSWAT